MSELGFALIGGGVGMLLGHAAGYARALRIRRPKPGYRRGVTPREKGPLVLDADRVLVEAVKIVAAERDARRAGPSLEGGRGNVRRPE